MFTDRREAGQKLAQKLIHYQGKNPLILAVPRGGVPVGLEIQALLGGDLDVIIPRKVGVPGQPELALGAVTADGGFLLNREIAESLNISEQDVSAEIKAAREETKRRQAIYRGEKPPFLVEGRTVILTDDGVATGFTIRAALQALREQKTARLILALPVSPVDTFKDLQSEVDELVCLEIAASFYAVGQFYQDFRQLSDEEVVTLLSDSVTK